jgi:hypothetical protein
VILGRMMTPSLLRALMKLDELTWPAQGQAQGLESAASFGRELYGEGKRDRDGRSRYGRPGVNMLNRLVDLGLADRESFRYMSARFCVSTYGHEIATIQRDQRDGL